MHKPVSVLFAIAASLTMSVPTAVATPAPVRAPQAGAGDPVVERRAAELATLLREQSGFENSFSPEFLKAIPPEQLKALAAQLAGTLGEPRAVKSVVPRAGSAAQVVVAFARGTASFDMVIEAAGDRRIIGLRVLGTDVAGETVDTVVAAFRALPGMAGFGIYALGQGRPVALGGYRGDAAAPVASTFKLWVLSALSQSIARGRHRWSEVVALKPGPFASGALAKWPAGAPITLHSLATMMISVSDNMAADTAMAAVGRGAVDAEAASVGVAGPVLTTAETTAIKSDAAMTERWRVAAPAARSAMLAGDVARRIAAGPGDMAIFASGRPVAIDRVEWFASPAQVAATLDRLRVPAAASARAILAVNPGMSKALAAKFDYVGFKGGSEPGVIAMSFLVKTRENRWYAVVGNWHRTDQGVDDAAFVALMGRALNLVATGDTAKPRAVGTNG